MKEDSFARAGEAFECNFLFLGMFLCHQVVQRVGFVEADEKAIAGKSYHLLRHRGST